VHPRTNELKPNFAGGIKKDSRGKRTARAAAPVRVAGAAEDTEADAAGAAGAEEAGGSWLPHVLPQPPLAGIRVSCAATHSEKGQLRLFAFSRLVSLLDAFLPGVDAPNGRN
jgi:hypothetical protein